MQQVCTSYKSIQGKKYTINKNTKPRIIFVFFTFVYGTIVVYKCFQKCCKNVVDCNFRCLSLFSIFFDKIFVVIFIPTHSWVYNHIIMLI